MFDRRGVDRRAAWLCLLSLCCVLPLMTNAADILFMNVYTDDKTSVYFKYGTEETALLRYGESVRVTGLDDTLRSIPITVYKLGAEGKGPSPSPAPPEELAKSTMTSLRPEQGGNAVFAYQARQGRTNIWAVRIVQGATPLAANRFRLLVVNFSPSKTARFLLDGVSFTGSLETRGGMDVVDSPLALEGSKKYEFVDDNNNNALASSSLAIDTKGEQGRAIVIALYGTGAGAYRYKMYVKANTSAGGGGAPVGAIVGGILGVGVVAGVVAGAVVVMKKKKQGGSASGGKVVLPSKSGGGGGGGLVGATAAAPPPPIPARDGPAGRGGKAPPIPAREAAPPVPARDAAPVIPPRV